MSTEVSGQERRYFLKAFRKPVERETSFYRTYEAVDANTLRVQEFEKNKLIVEGAITPIIPVDSVDACLWHVKDLIAGQPIEDDCIELYGDFAFLGWSDHLRAIFKERPVVLLLFWQQGCQ